MPRTLTIPARFCVIGPASTGRQVLKRRWFTDPISAASHAANLMDRDPDTRELYVVEIVRVVRPKEPKSKYDFFDVEA